MGKKWKGTTTIGLMAGAEVGADFFRSWRVAKARSDFVKNGVDFIIIPGCLLNVDALNAQFVELRDEKKAEKNGRRASEENGEKNAKRKEPHLANGKIKPVRGKKVRITAAERVAFCKPYVAQILEEVLPPIRINGDLVKYWVFPCPLFELKRDKFGFAAYIYESLARESQKISGKDPYIRIGNEDELIEIEDNVAIRTLGITMPKTSFFRPTVLSTPVEREIRYQQLSSLPVPIPDLYVAGSFAVTINEVNPRIVPMPRPYVSIPSLSIKLGETVLQNTLGYAILKLFPDQKNRASYQFSCFPLDDAIELECLHAQRQIQSLPNEHQRKVAAVIIDKVRRGTKVTLGKIEVATGLTRDQVTKAVNGLKKTHFKVDLDLGEIINPHRIIPKTKRDLTEYREGKETERTFVAGACFHIPDTGVDYDFLENDLPRIIIEEKAETLYIVGDITEGNKYDQDRKGQLLDRFSFPQDQKKLAGFLVATRIVLPVFIRRYAETHDIASSILRVVNIPGNHDEVRNEPPLEAYERTLLDAATDFIYGHLTTIEAGKTPIDYHQLMELIRTRMVFLDNPAVDGKVGMLHEYSQSAEQSTGKVQKAIKQFMVLSPDVVTLLLANHHEENFSLIRIGTKTMKTFHLGTLKRFYSFESQRSKISEFGVAVDREVVRNHTLVRTDTKFIPSRIDFQMQRGADFNEQNRVRGIRYYEELKEYMERGYRPKPATK